MNNCVNFVKAYAAENELSYKEAMKEPKNHYQSGGSLKSNFVRNIIYKAHKFNPNKMNKKSKYIQEGKYFDKHQEIFYENEDTNKVRKIRSDLITKKLLDHSNINLSPEQINNNKLDEFIAVINDFNIFLLSGRKSMFKSAEKIEMFESISSAIRGYDYYPTPAKYADMIFNDVKKWYKNDMNNISILDIACGLLSLSMPFIRNGNNVYLNEFNPQFTKILQPLDELENVKLTKGDFFELPEEHYFKKDIDVIVINPPFSGYIDGKNDKKIYLYFIIKAMDILHNSKIQKYDNTARFLYVICPKTHFRQVKVGDLVDFDIPQTYIKKANKMFDIDYLEDITPHITFMSDVNGFRTLRKGKPIELKATFGLYKFEIV